MITLMIVCAIIACIAPLWLIFEVERQLDYDEDGNETEDSIPFYQTIWAAVLGVMSVSFILLGCMIMYNMSTPVINTAHRLEDLEHRQIYKILQKWEHHWRTYYYVEHANGHGGLYWCKTGDFDLDIGYYKLESEYQYKKMKFTPLEIRMDYCAT